MEVKSKTFVSIWTCFQQFYGYNNEPKTGPTRTLLEVEEDGRAGRPLSGRVKDGETVPPRHAASREGEKETRRDGASADAQTT